MIHASEISTNVIHNWQNVSRNAVIIDTETTGVGRDAELLELTILDTKGNVLFNQLIKPFGDIPEEATAIHGIGLIDVLYAPHWDEVVTEVRQILHQRNVIAYRCEFDARIIQQTNNLFGLDNIQNWACNWYCAMRSFADFAKQPDEKHGGYRWFKLINAAKYLGIEPPEQLHRSLPDTELTLAVLNGAYQALQAQTAAKTELEQTA